MEVKAVAAQIQTCVQHRAGLLSVAPVVNRRLPLGRPSFIGFLAGGVLLQKPTEPAERAIVDRLVLSVSLPPGQAGLRRRGVANHGRLSDYR
jgi:hypothetical protein